MRITETQLRQIIREELEGSSPPYFIERVRTGKRVLVPADQGDHPQEYPSVDHARGVARNFVYKRREPYRIVDSQGNQVRFIEVPEGREIESSYEQRMAAKRRRAREQAGVDPRTWASWERGEHD